MEDFQLDLMIGEGPAARSVRIDLPPFTLVGATTRTGLLTTPLRDRSASMPGSNSTRWPSSGDLLRGARLLGFELRGRAREIARRARGHTAGGNAAAAPGA